MTAEVLYNKTDTDDLNEKEVGSSSRRNVLDFDLNIPATDAIDASEDKAFSGKHSKSSASCHEKEPSVEVAEASHESNHNGSSLQREHHLEPLTPTSNAADCNVVENVETVSSSSSTELGVDGHDAEENSNKTSSNFSIFGLLGQRYIGNMKASDVPREVEFTSASGSSTQIGYENVNSKNQHKSKEKIQRDKEGHNRISNEREDSNESMESSNGSKNISKGKRPFDYGSNIVAGSKRLKMDNSEGSCSRSLVKRKSSFMNWMSSITNSVARLSQSIPSEMCGDSPKSTKENHLCLTDEKAISNEKQPMGFTSAFHSYSSSSVAKNLPNNGIQREMDDGQEPRTSYPLFQGHQNLERNSSLIKQKTDERKEPDNIKDSPNHDSDNLFSHDRILSYVPSSSPDVASSSSRNFYENLWITRFLRKDSVLAARPLRCHFATQLENDTRVNEISDVAPETQCQVDNDDSDAGNHCSSNLKCQNLATYKVQQHASTGLASRNSHRSAVGPSKAPLHQFEESEARISFFVERLDASKYIMPMRESDKLLPCSTTACTFKDKNAPNGSSRIVELSSEDPQFQNYDDIHQSKKLQPCIKSNDGVIAAPCFTKCFRTKCSGNAYRGTCSKTNNAAHNSWISMQNNPGNHGSCSYETEIAFPGNPLREHDQKVIQIIKAQRGESRVQSDLDAHTSHCTDKLRAPFVMPSNQPEGSICETMALTTQFSSGSRKANARENQLKPLCITVADEASDEQTGIFEAIRRLRLSRTEMLRLLTSPNAFGKLEGFFLRLRLGQRERKVGGTGYHVARINGASCEGTLTVNIGHFTCILDTRFVSNHDYIEDELKQWWSATLRSGEIPSKEELNMKINERAMLCV